MRYPEKFQSSALTHDNYFLLKKSQILPFPLVCDAAAQQGYELCS